jgi:hypothetical protein
MLAGNIENQDIFLRVETEPLENSNYSGLWFVFREPVVCRVWGDFVEACFKEGRSVEPAFGEVR